MQRIQHQSRQNMFNSRVEFPEGATPQTRQRCSYLEARKKMFEQGFILARSKKTF